MLKRGLGLFFVFILFENQHQRLLIFKGDKFYLHLRRLVRI